MKEIKLKVWNGNSIIDISDGGYRLIYNNSNSWRVIFGDNTDHSILASSEDGSILMQYTGLKDKNGKEIYEGDLFKRDGRNAIDVVIDIRNFASRYEKYEGRLLIEIIGNIYENPELLSN